MRAEGININACHIGQQHGFDFAEGKELEYRKSAPKNMDINAHPNCGPVN